MKVETDGSSRRFPKVRRDGAEVTSAGRSLCGDKEGAMYNSRQSSLNATGSVSTVDTS